MLHSLPIPSLLHIRICDARLPPGGGGKVGPVALPVKALKAGQESYWLDQIARNREEYFSGRGESPGRFVGSAAAAAGLEGVASPRAGAGHVPGPGPGHRGGAVRAAVAGRPALQAGRRAAAGGPQDPRHRAGRGGPGGAGRVQGAQGRRALGPGGLPAGRRQAGQGGDGRAALPQGPRRRPRELYGEAFDKAWQHRGKRVNERVQAFDHCFSSPKSVSLLAAGGSPRPGGCWPRAAPRPSRSPSATWSATASGSAATTTAPTATRRSGGWWRWPSSTA